LSRLSRDKRKLGFYWDFILWQAPNPWLFLWGGHLARQNASGQDARPTKELAQLDWNALVAE
jgi:hypothetical protein